MHQPPQQDGRGHQQPGYPQPSPDLGNAHRESEPKSISDPFESPFLGGQPALLLAGPRVGTLGAERGDQDLETRGVFPLYPDPVPQQG